MIPAAEVPAPSTPVRPAPYGTVLSVPLDDLPEWLPAWPPTSDELARYTMVSAPRPGQHERPGVPSFSSGLDSRPKPVRTE